MIPADLAQERQRVLRMIEGITPGEWLREDGLVNGFVFALNGEGTNRMALSISCGLLDNGMRALPKEVHANSALIAAAPALAQSYAEALGELERVRSALSDLLSWFPDAPSPPEWRLRAGAQGADDAVYFARSALAPAPEERHE